MKIEDTYLMKAEYWIFLPTIRYLLRLHFDVQLGIYYVPFWVVLFR